MTASTDVFIDRDEGEPMPAGWPPYPTREEIAEHEAFLASLGPVERDDPPHPEYLVEPIDLFADPAVALTMLAGEASGATSFDLAVLEAIDPAALTEPVDKLTVLKALDKIDALVGALRIRTLVALGGAAPGGALLEEMHLEHEIAVARRTSDYAAGRAVELARTITTTFPEFLAALGAGRVSWSHLAVLVERTRFVQDQAALAQIGARALVRARTRTPGQFGTEVEKLVARFDPDAAERHRNATKRDRRVWAKQLADGMGMLGYIDEWAVVNAVYETLNTDAKTVKKARKDKKKAQESNGGDRPEAGTADASSEEEPSADSDRADALAARVLGVVGEDGSVTWDRAASTHVQTSLVVDLPTLQGLREGIALLDGQPIPAGIAREIAQHTKSWRRFVTDPVTGHLIDRGTEVYIDPHLRSFVLDRDICRNPVHEHALGSIRLEMDHAEEHPHGPTSAGNCGGACKPSHQLKTFRKVDITDSNADGSCTWTTAWGQVVHIPPRPFLDHPDPPTTSHPQPAPPDRAGPTTHAPAPADHPGDDPPPF